MKEKVLNLISKIKENVSKRKYFLLSWLSCCSLTFAGMSYIEWKFDKSVHHIVLYLILLILGASVQGYLLAKYENSKNNKKK